MKFEDIFEEIVAILKNTKDEMLSCLLFLAYMVYVPVNYVYVNYISGFICTIKNKIAENRSVLTIFLIIVFLLVFDYTLTNFDLIDIDRAYMWVMGHVVYVWQRLIYIMILAYVYYIEILNYIYAECSYILSCFEKDVNLLIGAFFPTTINEEYYYLLLMCIFICYLLVKFIFFLFYGCDIKKNSAAAKKYIFTRFFIVTKHLCFIGNKTYVGINFLLICFKKIYMFLYNFFFVYLLNLIKTLFLKILKRLPLSWKPTLKKWSYYGLYKAYRSKWFKK